MPYQHHLRRRVEFCETDAAGIVHFAQVFRYAEACEHDFWRSLGHSVHPRDPQPGELFGWPRVEARCAYRRPLRFEEQLEVRLLLSEVGHKRVSYAFGVRSLDEPGPGWAATGAMTAVSVTRDPDGRIRAIPVPPSLAGLLEVAPPEALRELEDTR